MSVLLLNASFEPLRVISVKRAVCLIVAQKAEVVEQKPGRFRSATDEVPVPAVIRLRYFVKIPFRATVPLNRRAVMQRDNHTCQYCRKSGDTIDHVVPRSRGGAHVWENVVLACRRCNGIKDDRLLEELGWTLPTRPFAPKGTYWLILGASVEADPAWEPYLAVA